MSGFAPTVVGCAATVLGVRICMPGVAGSDGCGYVRVFINVLVRAFGRRDIQQVCVMDP